LAEDFILCVIDIDYLVRILRDCGNEAGQINAIEYNKVVLHLSYIGPVANHFIKQNYVHSLHVLV
jgi:hypothetical protein